MGKKAKAKAKEKARRRELESAGSSSTERAGPPTEGSPEPPGEASRAGPTGEPRDAAGSGVDLVALAGRLSAVAIHLLRTIEREGASPGVTAARLSALSVLVLGGPRTLGALARSEGVTPPSMTRLVTAMARDGLVERGKSAKDGRLVLIRATPEGERLLHEGREGRVASLTGWLATLGRAGQRSLDEASLLLEALVGEVRPR